MALTIVENRLQTLGISEPDYLLYSPPQSLVLDSFDATPRYLFRIVSPSSSGVTNQSWVRSKDSNKAAVKCEVDIFSRANEEVATMLNRHLRWQGSSYPDNLVSWTSSLLYAIQGIFYRKHSSWSELSYKDIKLCVVDTSNFPNGVFLRDMDLIATYKDFDANLRSFEKLRQTQHRDFSGSYYFGEYLSQGSLKVEKHCQLVSAQDLIDAGLFSVLPELRSSEKQWANKVIKLRQPFYEAFDHSNSEPVEPRLQGMVEVAMLFSPQFRLPMAVYLISLHPDAAEGDALIKAFRGHPFTDAERADCLPRTLKTEDCTLLPEVEQYYETLWKIHDDFQLSKINKLVAEAELQLRRATEEATFVEDWQKPSQERSSVLKSTQQNLKAIERLCPVLAKYWAPS